MAKLHFILGGARSGKSRFAEQEVSLLAEQSDKSRVYIATAQAQDEEMCARIKHHQDRRDKQWQTVECPLDLTQTLKQLSTTKSVILVDCLTLWVTNWLCQHGEGQWQKAKQEFIHQLKNWHSFPADLVLVSNEVGHGIVPMGELSRQFVDESGWLHQEVAQYAQQVDFIMAGLPLSLKAST